MHKTSPETCDQTRALTDVCTNRFVYKQPLTLIVSVNICDFIVYQRKRSNELINKPSPEACHQTNAFTKRFMYKYPLALLVYTNMIGFLTHPGKGTNG